MTTLSSLVPVNLGEHVGGRQDLAQGVCEDPHLQAGGAGQRLTQRIGGADHRDAARVVGRERDGWNALAVLRRPCCPG